LNTLFTRVSENAKTGPIPVTITEKASCWTGCALHGQGCYAFYGALGHFWTGVSQGTRGGSWDELCAKVKALPKRTLWRYAQAGDLPGADDVIDRQLLQQLVIANRGRVHDQPVRRQPRASGPVGGPQDRTRRHHPRP
jgi:hypothetical protein